MFNVFKIPEHVTVIFKSTKTSKFCSMEQWHNNFILGQHCLFIWMYACIFLASDIKKTVTKKYTKNWKLLRIQNKNILIFLQCIQLVSLLFAKCSLILISGISELIYRTQYIEIISIISIIPKKLIIWSSPISLAYLP